MYIYVHAADTKQRVGSRRIMFVGRDAKKVIGCVLKTHRLNRYRRSTCIIHAASSLVLFKLRFRAVDATMRLDHVSCGAGGGGVPTVCESVGKRAVAVSRTAVYRESRNGPEGDAD